MTRGFPQYTTALFQLKVTTDIKVIVNMLWSFQRQTELSCGLSAHLELSMLLSSSGLEHSTECVLNKTLSIHMGYPGRKGMKMRLSTD